MNMRDLIDDSILLSCMKQKINHLQQLTYGLSTKIS